MSSNLCEPEELESTGTLVDPRVYYHHGYQHFKNFFPASWIEHGGGQDIPALGQLPVIKTLHSELGAGS